MTNALLGMRGIGKLASFYGYIHLNQPGLTRMVGIALVLAVGAIHTIRSVAWVREGEGSKTEKEVVMETRLIRSQERAEGSDERRL